MVAPPAELRLALAIGSSAEWVAVVDVLDQLRRGERPDVRRDATVVSLFADGREHLAGALSWGSLDRLAAELEPAAQRLADGEPALVRTARTDTVNGIALLLTPDGADVHVGLVSVAALPWAGWFPDDPAHGAELYAYVAEHLDEVVAAGAQLGAEPATVDRHALAQALRREAALAAAAAAGLAR